MQATSLKGCETDGSRLMLSGPCGVSEIDSQDPGVRGVSILCTQTSSAQCSTMSQSSFVCSTLRLRTSVFAVRLLYDPKPARAVYTVSGPLSRSRTAGRMASPFVGIHGARSHNNVGALGILNHLLREQHFFSPTNHIYTARACYRIWNVRRDVTALTTYRHESFIADPTARDYPCCSVHSISRTHERS